jgi:hypothetical protein
MGPCIVRILQYISNKMQCYTVCFIWKLLYMFRVVPPPIIRNANNCIYSIWCSSHPYYYLPLSWKCWNRFECVTAHSNQWQTPHAVDKDVCAPDDGWKYRPKHVEQFPDKTNCVTLHFAGYILEHSTLSLNLVLDRGRWSKPRPGRFTPGKNLVPIVHTR